MYYAVKGLADLSIHHTNYPSRLGYQIYPCTKVLHWRGSSGGVQLPVRFHCQIGSGRGRHDKVDLVGPASSCATTGL